MSLDDYVRSELKRQHIPGLSLAVVHRGEIIAARGYGFANVELGVPATPETVYQIGSLTKQFTSVAVMLLVEEGKIRLDEPVTRCLESLPEAWAGVTARHLLNHTSGIVNFTSHADFARMQHFPTERAQVVALVADEPLQFPSGSHYAYSNTGYYLLGHVIEAVSGQTYADFLRDRVFWPLGMVDTRVGDWEAVIPRRAAGYRWNGDGWQNAEYFSLTWAFSAGAVVSTALDMALWNIAQNKGEFLPKAMWEEMWMPATLSSGIKSDYGFGWGISNHQGRRVLGHGGAAPGFTAFAECYRDDYLAVVILANIIPSEAAQVSRGVAEHFLRDLSLPM